MLCDIDAEFHSTPMGANSVEGSFKLHDTEDHHLTKIDVEFAGILSYMCPVLTSRNNFADTEPQYAARECKFLSLIQTFNLDLDSDQIDYHFDIPHLIQLSDGMRKRLTLAKRANESALGYSLPPSFSSQHHSYLQTLFVPWKERSSAHVEYSVKVTVIWQAKPGMGRLLGSTRQKSFRKPVIVMPFSTEGAKTALPRYSKTSGRHWQRHLYYENDSIGEPCCVFVDQIAKMKLLGNNCLKVDHPMDFTLELNSKWRGVHQIRVNINLVMTVCTKMTSKMNEVERRNSKMLINRVLVKPCTEQEDKDADTGLDNNLPCAHFNTLQRQLRGTLHLLDDSSDKSHLLTPAFTFAGLTMEYRLQVLISSPRSSHSIAFFTPTVTLDIDSQDYIPPPSYESVNTTSIVALS